MCWQALSLKEPASQELLEAVERERSFRVTPSRNTTIFHHPTLGDFELQHLPVGVNDPELEERIIQHLAAAAAMGRARHAGAQHSDSISSPLTQIAGETEAAAISVASASTLPSNREDELSHQMSPFSSGQNTSASGSAVSPVNRRGFSFNNRSTSSNSSSPNQERAGPSEFQSFSESLKSKFSAVSLRYKESISKSTRGWKERLFSRNSSMSDHGNEVQRDATAGITSVSSMMERLQTRENSRGNQTSVSHHSAESSVTEQDNQQNTGSLGDNPLSVGPSPASHSASSLSN
ncbi:hypothetical protein PTKIN_Ptkin06aG0074100 [Pterospermum kingtungense]